MKLKVNEKDEIVLFDFDAIQLSEEMTNARGIKKEFQQFNNEIESLRKKYFN